MFLSEYKLLSSCFPQNTKKELLTVKKANKKIMLFTFDTMEIMNNTLTRFQYWCNNFVIMYF